MQVKDAQIVLIDWIGRNMLSAFPEFSWQKFLAAAMLPSYTASALERLSSLKELGIIVNGEVNLDNLRRVVESGFSCMKKVQLPALFGETFWISRENAMDLLGCLESRELES